MQPYMVMIEIQHWSNYHSAILMYFYFGFCDFSSSVSLCILLEVVDAQAMRLKTPLLMVYNEIVFKYLL